MVKSFTHITLLTIALASSLAWVHDITAPVIADNRAAAQWREARVLAGDPSVSGPWVDDRLPLADGRVLLRKRANGYGGELEALVLVHGTAIAGVRVVRHAETPGIADFLDEPDRGWMLELRRPDLSQLDGVTGATITSNAMIQLVSQGEPQ